MTTTQKNNKNEVKHIYLNTEMNKDAKNKRKKKEQRNRIIMCKHAL